MMTNTRYQELLDRFGGSGPAYIIVGGKRVPVGGKQ